MGSRPAAHVDCLGFAQVSHQTEAVERQADLCCNPLPFLAVCRSTSGTVGLDTSAAFASATGGAALRFLFGRIHFGIRLGVEDFHFPDFPHVCIGEHVAWQHQMALPRLHQIIDLGAWG